jgi:hypothetical protein
VALGVCAQNAVYDDFPENRVFGDVHVLENVVVVSK